MEKNYIAEKKGRVNVLDVLRVIAIVMVILSHYYLNYPDVGRKVAWGALGVQLFFIISGFVIYASLENTKNYRDFIVKRFLRLSPAMLICSTIIFVFFRFFYTGEGYGISKVFVNYLIANTFIDPTFINVFFGRVRYYHIDGAFWSLWAEVCFYSLIGFLYFINKEKFIKYYVIICAPIIPIYMLFYTSTGQGVLQTTFSLTAEQVYLFKIYGRALVFFDNSFWFLIGIFIYLLNKDKTKKKYIYYIALLLLINTAKEKFDISLIVFSVIVFAFFMVFVYAPEKVEFMVHPLLCKIGVASYSMYLIHYYLGMVAVKYLKENVADSYIWPFLVMVVVILFGLFSYNYLEKPLGKLYKKVFKV